MLRGGRGRWRAAAGGAGAADVARACAGALIVGVVLLGACSPSGERHLVREGYVGWVCVAFGVAGAPALEREDGFRVVTFPESGFVETSEPASRSVRAVEEYWFVAADGTRRAAPASEGRWVAATADTPERWCAFVGTPGTPSALWAVAAPSRRLHLVLNQTRQRQQGTERGVNGLKHSRNAERRVLLPGDGGAGRHLVPAGQPI